MVLTEWDPNRIRDRVPLVLAAVGARRCGKSTSIAHLVYQMFEVFDLVVCFVGSAACSPTLEAMMECHPKWDTRFFFSHWNQPLIHKLLVQQEDLKREGIERHILILMDDVILTGKGDDSLAHMCMRGRHFNISVMMAAVSYTSINKRSRRSLDFLLVFSCPMQGDRKVLSWEYAQNSGTADWVLKNLEENQCLVFETSRKVQRLYVWRSQLLAPGDCPVSGGRSRLPALANSGTAEPPCSASEHRWADYQAKTPFSETSTLSSGPPATGEEEEKAGSASLDAFGSAYTSHREVGVLNG